MRPTSTSAQNHQWQMFFEKSAYPMMTKFRVTSSNVVLSEFYGSSATTFRESLLNDLYLVADTNLFFECQDLPNLDWSVFNASRIVIVVCKPVQEEIDAHKKTSSRTKRRAVKYGGIFREMLKSGRLDQEISCDNRDVVLRLDPTTRPCTSLVELDLSVNDDRIVGIAKSYAQRQDSEAMLLTHDTGPSVTAHSMGVPYYLIPDDWLGRQEENPDLAVAQRKIKAYESQEPAFDIEVEKLIDGRILFEMVDYLTFTPEELDGLVERLTSELPMQTNFKDHPKSNLQIGAERSVKYEGPSDEEIELYRTERYPSWIEECRQVFEDIPKRLSLQKQDPILVVKIKNTGNRPAQKARIRFGAQNNLIFSKVSSKDEVGVDVEPFLLPPAPKAPTGRWVSPMIGMIADKIHSTARIESISREILKARAPAAQPFPNPLFDLSDRLSVASMRERNPESFYWRGSPENPSAFVELQCESWRHNDEPEEFSILVQPIGKKLEGLISVSVTANNLTHPILREIPARFEKRTVSALEYCRSLIEKGRLAQNQVQLLG